MKKRVTLLLVFVATFFSACSESDENPGKKTPFKEHSNAIILQWNTTAFNVMQGPAYDPMMASRVLAMMHIASHDALNGIAPVYESYSAPVLDKKADPIAAVSAAAYAVLVSSFPDKKDVLDAALAAAIKEIKSLDGKERGLSLGKKAAEAIIALRSNDGAAQDPIVEINNPAEPGIYQPVPPTPFVYAPHWKTLPTFSLQTPHQFRITPMPALTSQHYATDFEEVKLKGSKTSTTRTADETHIAKFWYELSEIGWNRVTATAVVDRKLDLLSTARLFALVNMALADSYIAGWDSKFYYNFWRPYTAIRQASTDGNPQTSPDAGWEPLMNTPPVQDYPSTHSVLGNAAATVLNEVLGNNVGFTMTSTSAEPVNSTRSFKTFTQAARENADSRVFAGIHFRFSSDKGMDLGEDIGQWTIQNHLKLKSAKGL
jgi:hypothetical protein